MTEWWFYIAGFFAALFLVNGVPHFVQGMSGKRFPTPFSGGAGTEDEAWRNVLWGAFNFVAGGVLLWLVRDGLTNIGLVVEMVVVGTAGATGFGYVFEHPERFRRKR